MIRGTRDLRHAYIELRLWEELTEDLKDRFDEDRLEKIYSDIAGMKREIREYVNRSSDRRLVKDEGIDGGVFLIRCPDEVTDESLAEEWFENCERIVPRWYPWDCTGQAFTNWHKVVKRRGRWWCYHSISRDV